MKNVCMHPTVSLEGFYIIQKVGLFIDSLEAEVHGCVEQRGRNTPQFTRAKFCSFSCLYLFFNYLGYKLNTAVCFAINVSNLSRF